MPTDDPKPSTTDQSATKAPENREHVESKARSKNDTLLPGGPHRATAEIGMHELNQEDVPTQAERHKI